MQRLYESVMARRNELLGCRAPAADVEQLRTLLPTPAFDPLLRVFLEFPVCTMMVLFAVQEGHAEGPRLQSEREYDSLKDHVCYWYTPAQMLKQMTEGARGEVAFQAGFVPIGMCAYGGDDYFLSTAPSPPGATPLYQVYYDWISYPALDDPPVPPEAIHLVHPSFESIIAVAEFRRGLMAPEQEDGDLR